MKKKVLSLIALLACTSLAIACNIKPNAIPSESSSTSSDDSNTPSGADYGDSGASEQSSSGDSASSADTSSDSSSSSSGTEDIDDDSLDAVIAKFVDDLDVIIPSLNDYDLTFDIFYYYAYEAYVIAGYADDLEGDILDAYLASFDQIDTGLISFNDEDYPAEEYGYSYGTASQSVYLNFFDDEDGYFNFTIGRYDGLYGSLDVSDVDTNWYVDYINLQGFVLLDEFPSDLILDCLELDINLAIPGLDADAYPSFFSEADYDEESMEYTPASFVVVFEGDQIEDYADILDKAGYDVDLVENEGWTIDWDLGEIVDYTYYTFSASDAGKTLFIEAHTDSDENTSVSFYKFDDVFTTDKTTNEDWTDADKTLMMKTLHQVLPFMQFGSGYQLYDASDEDYDYLVLEDNLSTDLSSNYIDLLLENGFIIDDETYYETFYVYDNGLVYIEIYVGYEYGNYLEIYFEDSHLPTLTSLNLNETAVDIVAGGSFQLAPVYDPIDATYPLVWSSSNNDVATVDDNGLVTINETAAVDSVVTIEATTLTGVSASCTFTVKANVASGIEILEDSYSLVPGGNQVKVEYRFLPYGATSDANVQFALDKTDVGINVDNNGNLSANNDAVVGTTATVTVSADDIGSDTANVTVVSAVVKDTLTREFFGIKSGDSTYATYKKTSENGAEYEAYAAGNNGLQIRSKTSDSGVIGHLEGKTCKSITVTFDSNTEVPGKDRAVEVYASNTPFDIEDMFGSSVTKVATLNFDKNNLTASYTFTSAYSYIGFRSTDGAVYLTSVEIEWQA